MDVLTPSTEQLASLLATHAARFPTPASITMVGDRGVPVRLPFVLGNPTGACPQVSERERTTTWGVFIAATMKLVDAPDHLAETGAAECVLYPDAVTYAEWRARWPALSAAVWSAVKQKCGTEQTAIDEPAFDDELATPVREAAVASPSACLRRFTMRRKKADYSVVLVIDSPKTVSWRFFIEAMRKPKADHWQLTREMAEACIKVAYDETAGAAVSLDEVVAPYPGVALLATLIVGQLAGVAADVELGEF